LLLGERKRQLCHSFHYKGNPRNWGEKEWEALITNTKGHHFRKKRDYYPLFGGTRNKTDENDKRKGLSSCLRKKGAVEIPLPHKGGRLAWTSYHHPATITKAERHRGERNAGLFALSTTWRKRTCSFPSFTKGGKRPQYPGQFLQLQKNVQ